MLRRGMPRCPMTAAAVRGADAGGHEHGRRARRRRSAVVLDQEQDLGRPHEQQVADRGAAERAREPDVPAHEAKALAHLAEQHAGLLRVVVRRRRRAHADDARGGRRRSSPRDRETPAGAGRAHDRGRTGQAQRRPAHELVERAGLGELPAGTTSWRSRPKAGPEKAVAPLDGRQSHHVPQLEHLAEASAPIASPRTTSQAP
jgi:hypothetical protein